MIFAVTEECITVDNVFFVVLTTAFSATLTTSALLLDAELASASMLTTPAQLTSVSFVFLLVSSATLMGPASTVLSPIPRILSLLALSVSPALILSVSTALQQWKINVPSAKLTSSLKTEPVNPRALWLTA